MQPASPIIPVRMIMNLKYGLFCLPGLLQKGLLGQKARNRACFFCSVMVKIGEMPPETLPHEYTISGYKSITISGAKFFSGPQSVPDLARMRKQDITILTRGVVFNRNQELLAQHCLTPETGFYRLPGGHIRLKEKVEGCVTRELGEETKLKVKAKRLLWVRQILDQHPGHTIEFFSLEPPAGKVKPASGRASKSELKFIPLEKLDHLTFLTNELTSKLKTLLGKQRLD